MKRVRDWIPGQARNNNKMISLKTTIFLLPIAVLLAACSHDGGYKLPGVYRIDIQQGNIIEREMLARLKPGMGKNQVKFVMGTPSLVDPFHTDQWEYIYTFSKGGRDRRQRHITLYFKEDKLAYIDGDVVPGLERPDEILSKPTTTIDVLLRKEKRRGFFSKIFNALPFIGDAGEMPEAREESEVKETVGADKEETTEADVKGKRE